VDLILVGHRGAIRGVPASAGHEGARVDGAGGLARDADRILVPIDFSEPAADAMQVATAMARGGIDPPCCTSTSTSAGDLRGVSAGVRARSRRRTVDLAPIDCARVTPCLKKGPTRAPRHLADGRKYGART
jgi:hypothetical protein